MKTGSTWYTVKLSGTSLRARLLVVYFGLVLGICQSIDTVVVGFVETLDLVLSLLPLASLPIINTISIHIVGRIPVILGIIIVTNS